jgi:hypothetical protein
MVSPEFDSITAIHRVREVGQRGEGPIAAAAASAPRGLGSGHALDRERR